MCQIEHRDRERDVAKKAKACQDQDPELMKRIGI